LQTIQRLPQKPDFTRSVVRFKRADVHNTIDVTVQESVAYIKLVYLHVQSETHCQEQSDRGGRSCWRKNLLEIYTFFLKMAKDNNSCLYNINRTPWFPFHRQNNLRWKNLHTRFDIHLIKSMGCHKGSHL